MKEAHKDLKLNDDHFNTAIEYFRTILKDMNINTNLLQETMMYLEPLRSQITQRPTQSLFDRVKGRIGIKTAVQSYFE